MRSHWTHSSWSVLSVHLDSNIRQKSQKNSIRSASSSLIFPAETYIVVSSAQYQHLWLMTYINSILSFRKAKTCSNMIDLFFYSERRGEVEERWKEEGLWWKRWGVEGVRGGRGRPVDQAEPNNQQPPPPPCYWCFFSSCAIISRSPFPPLVSSPLFLPFSSLPSPPYFSFSFASSLSLLSFSIPALIPFSSSRFCQLLFELCYNPLQALFFLEQFLSGFLPQSIRFFFMPGFVTLEEFYSDGLQLVCQVNESLKDTVFLFLHLFHYVPLVFFFARSSENLSCRVLLFACVVCWSERSSFSSLRLRMSMSFVKLKVTNLGPN